MWNEPIEPFIALALPVGLLLCFGGGRSLQFTAALAAALAVGGAATGWAQTAALSTVGAITAGALLAAVAALAATLFLTPALFLLGFAAGALLGATGATLWAVGIAAWKLTLGLGLACAFAAVGVPRVAVPALASVLGAWAATSSVLHFCAGIDPLGELVEWQSLPTPWNFGALFAWGSLTAGGWIIQLRRAH